LLLKKWLMACLTVMGTGLAWGVVPLKPLEGEDGGALSPVRGLRRHYLQPPSVGADFRLILAGMRLSILWCRWDLAHSLTMSGIS
jgi:hypothetical protein